MGIKQKFEDKVIELCNQKEIPDIEVRKKQVEDLTEWYYAVAGQVYKGSYYLDMLGSYLLSDILRDKSVHKVKQAEFPILSDRQIKLRNRRESRVGDENIDFIKLKEVDNTPSAFKKKTQQKDD